MSFANFTAGSISAMPMCHGAGGLAAHYRFGARSGGSNLMIGAIFIAIAMLFGKVAVSVLSLIPVSILGVLLFFAGLELAMLIKDVEKREDFFITFAIAGIGLATMNMGYAFIAGMVMKWVMDKAKIEI
jgi:SulP family sulfate permease